MTPFADSEPFTVGIEEELLLVDPATLRLTPVAGEILTRMRTGSGEAGHEAYAAQIELRSPSARSAETAVTALAELRRSAINAGATLMGVGVHPSGARGDAPLHADERYRAVAGSLRGLLRVTPESALHVHVGMPDAERAVRAYNGLRQYLPLFQALTANSPWWFGTDSGLASARYALVRSYPGRGVPRALRDYADWEDYVAELTRAGGLQDYTYLWTDLRLHPNNGTVEVREMDSQASLEHVAAISALVRSLAVEAVDRPPRCPLSSEALGWSCFRAARDGTDATILWEGRERTVLEIGRATVDRLRQTSAALGDEAPLLSLERILNQGGGAARQRRSHALGGMRSMLRSLVRDTHLAASEIAERSRTGSATASTD